MSDVVSYAPAYRQSDSYPGGERTPPHDLSATAIAVPLRLRHDGTELVFIST
jgi:hypothetical protein